MEASWSRFTAAEGGARLANAARERNTIAAEHTTFVAMRLLHEEAYRIRGSLFEGAQRSVYITRPSRVKCVAYDIGILTDLTVINALAYDDVYDWMAEMETKQVLVCTSDVFKHVLQDEVLSMENINVMIIDSCHLICKDEHLKFIMKSYKEASIDKRPRILALTYPLFSSIKKDSEDHKNKLEIDENISDSNTNCSDNDNNSCDNVKNSNVDEKNSSENDKNRRDDNVKNTNDDNKNSSENDKDSRDDNVKNTNDDNKNSSDNDKGSSDNNEKSDEKIENDIDVRTKSDNIFKIGKYENFDDFNMYEQLEWKIDVLEDELCCQADLAEDIDGVKRISSTPTKPMELIIEYSSGCDVTSMPASYIELESFMRGAVDDAMRFLDDHRYDPTEIYGEDLYEELKNIPDPTEDPKLILHQFLYVLDQLGPYAADKAAFSLLTKLEKLKIKIPYERHFLLYCIITTVFVKIRCFSDIILSEFETEWDKIRNFSTPKVLRFVEILEKFKPNESYQSESDKLETKTDKLLKEIDNCDFITLSNTIEDTVNTYEANLKEIHEHITDKDLLKSDEDNSSEKNDNDSKNSSDNSKIAEIINDITIDNPKIDETKSENDKQVENINDKNESDNIKPGLLGFRRQGHKLRGRGRVPRNNASRVQQMLLNPDALCGIVFMKEPLMAKILFMLIVELSRKHPSLNFLCAQYSAIEKVADPLKEPREFEQQRRKQEDVLKKFRMHECNLLLATSALEEGIDLPRCNLVLRWDVPASYRSHALCRGRARAPRSACALLAAARRSHALAHHVAAYTALDQIVTRKCGCGIQDEPPQTEEDHADIFTNLISPYTPAVQNTSDNDKRENDNKNDKSESDNINTINENEGVTSENSGYKNDKVVKEVELASVDLSTAIALINRYCGKLPSDTFTRLAPQWWLEKVRLPVKNQRGVEKDAFICTLRLPLNCPVKYNIVGHPMPTRVLARRMVALQACRILHKSGELDNQLMPIGKENFKAADLDLGAFGTMSHNDPNDLARPGTTKRRQYYYKRTAKAFTDCQPIVDTTDAEIEIDPLNKNAADKKEVKTGKRNMLYAIQCELCCALPERYNTRGRRLHAPQGASQALAILIARSTDESLQIPSFPVYTRSGEVRVSVQRIPDADVRVSPRRARLVRRFMRFVFAEVLRVRRRGMKLQEEGTTDNNYYIVPTVKSARQDGSIKIDIDWGFLELIYKYTEDRKHSSIEKPILWHQDEEEKQDIENDKNRSDKLGNDSEKLGETEKLSECEKPCEVENSNENPHKSDKLGNYSDKLGETEKSSESDKPCKVENSNEKPNKSDSVKVSDTHSGNDKQIDNEYAKDKDETNNESDKSDNDNDDKKNKSDKSKIGYDKSRKVRKMDNPLLKPGEVFVFDPEKYREAVVTPWYRNQDQPQFFLVAEICTNLTPDSAFPSASHTTFRSYYKNKYGVTLTQANQPLLDVDHTSARLNLLTPRYVNRKGVALPVSSERTRRAKRDRLDQKQILVPELCSVHPFPAPLWFATVALPCILYRINALLIADEIRQAVATEVGLGIAKITDPEFQWPPLDFGWSLAEVLSADSEKNEKKKEDDPKTKETDSEVIEDLTASMEKVELGNGQEKTLNDILQETVDAESGFEIGTWSNEMASSIPQSSEYDELLEPLPPNLTFCTSASGGTNWCDPPEKPRNNYNPSRNFSMADSDCSYMSSDFDTDDSDLNSAASEDETDTSGFSSSRNSNAAMGVRIEYKTAHEAEAFDLERKRKTHNAPEPDERDDYLDRVRQEEYLKGGGAPDEYIEKFRNSLTEQKHNIINKHLIKETEIITEILPDPPKEPVRNTGFSKELFDELFPYEGITESQINTGISTGINTGISLEAIEKNKRVILQEYKNKNDVKTMNCYSMKDVNIDSPNFKDNKIPNFDFSVKNTYVPYYKDESGRKLFDFDYQPDLEGHPGPSPSLILQALTMSNANDGINLERLETIGDSFLKFAITAYLYCALPTVHEGKLSHMRSKQVSNLNLYRLGRSKKLGTLMIASKFEPHDNWLPPCHKAPETFDVNNEGAEYRKKEYTTNDGCFIPYNLITQHSIPDKSIADCVEALIGAYLIECGPRGALLFMSWLGIRVLPTISHETKTAASPRRPAKTRLVEDLDSEDSSDELWPSDDETSSTERVMYGELKAPPSPLLRYVSDPEGELERMLSGYSALENTLQYRFSDRSLLLQALTHASHARNTLTDCYQRLEFLGDAILDYLITRHLYEEPRRHSPGALTDLRSALVNNTIFSTLAVRHGFHKFFRHMSPGLNEVLTKYVKIQEENGHSISEEHYLIQEDEMEQAEDVEVPKALGDLFESVAGAIFLDSGMSLAAVWRPYERLMAAELEAFSAAAPKSPVRELLEAEPDTAKFGKPERLADGRRVRVSVEVFGRGCFKGVGRNYRIAKGTAARCALRHLKKYKTH